MIPVVPDSSTKGKRRKKRAFTLVEILASLAVSCLVMAAIATIVVLSAKIIEKGKQADAAATQTRLFQETLVKEMSLAVADTVPIDTTKLVGPNYSGASSTVPVRYSRVTYRVIVGRVAYVTADTPSTQT